MVELAVLMVEVVEVEEVIDKPLKSLVIHSTAHHWVCLSPSLPQTGAQLLAGSLLRTEIKLLIEKRILYVVWLLSAVYTLYI